MYLKNNILIGVILYLIPFSCCFLIFRLFSFLIEPSYSIENAIYAYLIYLVLLLLSFFGSYVIAFLEKERSWWIKFLFALIAIIQFLPVIILACIGALCIYINSKSKFKNSRFGCTITSILAAVSSFSLMLFIVESGNVKTSRNIGKAVFVYNHLSSGDYFVAALTAIFRNWRVMIGENLWKFKIFHWFFNRVGIPIKRERDLESAQKREEAVEDSIKFLRENNNAVVGVYSQGTRERDPSKGITGFKKGAFRIACEVGCPIVPIVILKTNIWRKPWKQDTSSHKGKKQNYFDVLKGYTYQFFKTGINPTIIKVIHCSPVSSVGKKPEELRIEVQEIMNIVYLKHYNKRA